MIDILKAHDLNPNDYDCHGTVCEIDGLYYTHDGKHYYFIVHTEIAWGQVWEAICEKYTGIFTVYTAEELGYDILINTNI